MNEGRGKGEVVLEVAVDSPIRASDGVSVYYLASLIWCSDNVTVRASFFFFFYIIRAIDASVYAITFSCFECHE